MSSPTLSLLQYLRSTAAALRATTGLVQHVLRSLPYGMGWVMKICLIGFLCVGSLAASAYVWQAVTLPLLQESAGGLHLAWAKEETLTRRHKDVVSEDCYRQPPLPYSPERGDKENVNQPRQDLYGDPLPPGAVARLGTTRFRPGRSDDFLCFSSDGKVLFTASRKHISSWDRDSGKMLHRFGDFPGPQGAAISADRLVVACWQAAPENSGAPNSQGDVLHLWNTSTGKLVRKFKGRCGPYAISPDGKLVVGDIEGQFGVWDILTGRQLWKLTIKEGNSFAFSSDGEVVASGAVGDGVTLWDVRTGRRLRTWGGEAAQSNNYGITFSSDSRRLLIESTTKQGFRRQLYDRVTGKARPLCTEGNRPSLSPSGEIMVTSEQGVSLWDTTTGEKLRRLENSDSWCRPYFSPDGRILVGSGKDDSSYLWDVATGKQLRRCENSRVRRGRWNLYAFSPNGEMLAGIRDGRICCWETASGKILTQLEAPGHPVASVVFTPDGESLVSRDFSGVVRIWDAHSGRQQLAFAKEKTDYRLYEALDRDDRRRLFEGDCEIALSRDGRFIAANGPDNQAPANRKRWCIYIWEAKTGLMHQKLKRGGIPGDFSPDGKWLACTHFSWGTWGDTEVILWDTAAGKQLPQRFRGRNPAFSADGVLLVTQVREREKRAAGVENREKVAFYIWDVASGKKLCSIEEETQFFAHAVFSSSGYALWALLIPDPFRTTGQKRKRVDEEKVKWYPLHRGKPSGMRVGDSRIVASCEKQERATVIAREGGRDMLRASKRGVCAISADNRLVAFIEANWQVISVRETVTGLERCRFHAHNDEILCLAFSADSRRLASGSVDTTVLVWDVTGRLNGKGLCPARLSAEALEQRWADLACGDASRAGRAIWTLVAAGSPTIALLEKRLRPVPHVAPQAINQWITDLDASTYAVRKQARQKLTALGEAVEPDLRHALEKHSSLEKRRTLQLLLDALKPGLLGSGDKLRSFRAIEVLEHIGTPEARKLLEHLASGAPGARQTEEVKASLRRLSQRTVKP